MRRRSVIGLLLLVAIGTATWTGRRYLYAGYALVNLDGLYAEFDLEEVPRGARVVAFVAHGDDECFLMAGTLVRMKRERGAHVTLVSMSGDRRAELEASAETLGLDDVRIMEGLGDVATADIAFLDEEVAHVLDELAPTVVICFGPEGITGHPDHQASGLSVWRSALRRGTPFLMRVVMPKEFAPFVATYAYAPEPGWGICPIERVPLGDAGALRSASAACYPTERDVLERNEWHANLVNTEFFSITRQDGPANGPELVGSKGAVLSADDVLVVVHPTELWDLEQCAKPATDALVERFESAGLPVALLVNASYPFTYLESRETSRGFVSSGGEHELSIDSSRLWFAGGSWGSCLERGIRGGIESAIENGAQSVEVMLPPDAVYVVHFDEERAVTLREEAAVREGGAVGMLGNMIERLLVKDMTNYPAQPSLAGLGPLLEGWSIRFLADGGEHLFREGDAGELVIRVD